MNNPRIAGRVLMGPLGGRRGRGWDRLEVEMRVDKKIRKKKKKKTQ